jgi:hypothetical protein
MTAELRELGAWLASFSNEPTRRETVRVQVVPQLMRAFEARVIGTVS